MSARHIAYLHKIGHEEHPIVPEDEYGAPAFIRHQIARRLGVNLPESAGPA